MTSLCNRFLKGEHFWILALEITESQNVRKRPQRISSPTHISTDFPVTSYLRSGPPAFPSRPLLPSHKSSLLSFGKTPVVQMYSFTLGLQLPLRKFYPWLPIPALRSKQSKSDSSPIIYKVQHPSLTEEEAKAQRNENPTVSFWQELELGPQSSDSLSSDFFLVRQEHTESSLRLAQKMAHGFLPSYIKYKEMTDHRTNPNH